MKKINYYFLLFSMAFLSTISLKAQEGPYLEALYDVQVTENVVYGANATILPVIFQQTNEAILQPLIMDIYEPVGDGNTDRPVMLVFHTGNFLPHPQNNGTGGTLRDSTVVEACTRLAQRGYLAAAVDYRLGWNPIDPSQDIRTFFLINAAYRGVQDARTAARFMRLNAVDGGDPYGIDPDKIGIWGIGTGGYIAAAVATLDEYSEVVIPKFLINLGMGDVPMVIESINGDINGTSVGIVPAGYPVLPEGDTLCYPNHVTYTNGDPISSDFQLIVNMGGALGDISWLDENVAPWVSFHVPTDPFAPYTNATLTVPGTGDPDDPSDDFAVVEVDGSYNIQEQMNTLGFNDIFNTIPNSALDYNEVADARNDGHEGLFPFPVSDPTESAPWDFYADDNPNAPDPPADPVAAKIYWDTIFAYTGVRACVALGLDCTLVSSKEVLLNDRLVSIAPNPASDYTTILTAENEPIQHIEVFNIKGQRMSIYNDINATQKTIHLNQFSSGMYIVKVYLEDGVVAKKIMLE